MYSKLSMKPVQAAGLSEHETKRCRALAKGQPWEVWEEDILWWSLDRQSWAPVDDSLRQRRRRWLIVETEQGVYVAAIWYMSQALEIPSLAQERSAADIDVEDPLRFPEPEPA